MVHSTQHFQANLSQQIEGLLSPERCEELIGRYEQDPGDEAAREITRDCADRVFTDEVKDLLQAYFQGGHAISWSQFDVVDDQASDYQLNTYWHLDGGIPKTLKLFIYLNGVSEHGGNTLIIDADRTETLRQAGALPFNTEDRFTDLTPVFKELGLEDHYLAYDLKAGDGLLFSPLSLAHKCLPPAAGQKRYTVSFTLIPAS